MQFANLGPVTIERYSVELDLDLDAGTFQSTTTMPISIAEPCDQFELDCAGLRISHCSWLSYTTGENHPCRAFYDTRTWRIISLSDAVTSEFEAGSSGELSISATGRLHMHDQARPFGIYTCKQPLSLADPPLIASHFEPAFACNVFPCSVDPRRRLPLALRVTVRGPSRYGQSLEQLTAISSGKLRSRHILPAPSSDSGRDSTTGVVFAFEETIPLPTYLYSFCVGSFEVVARKLWSERRQANLDIELCLPRNGFEAAMLPPKGRYIPELVECAVKCVRLLESYFDLAFPDPLLRIVCLPDHLLVGMENSNAIVVTLGVPFQRVLSDPSHKEYAKTMSVVKKVVLHEMLHSYIGNLVGCSVAAKEGIVLFLEEHLASKVTGSVASGAQSSSSTAKAGSGAGKRPVVHSHAPSKSSSSSSSAAAASAGIEEGEESLLAVFRAMMNLSVYDQYLAAVEKLSHAIGTAQLQSNLRCIVRDFGGVFVEDDALIARLSQPARVISPK